MPTSTPFDQLCKFTRAYMKRAHVPGAVVGALHRGRESVAAFGVTSIEQNIPVTADTLFQIGSNTKPMVATAAMRLVEQGKLKLDLPIRTYLPWFRMKDKSATANVTMRQLLTHVAGWQGDYFNNFGAGDDALDRMVRDMRRLEQEAPLGKVYSYNNASFYVAGRVLEVVTGKPFEKVIRELVFEPLGMTRSFFFPDDELFLQRLAAGHDRIKGRNKVSRPWALSRADAPAGGVLASAHDMLTFARFHMGDGRVNGKRVLKAASLRHMQTPRLHATGLDWLGLSWFMRTTAKGMKVVLHGGATAGQNSGFWFLPEKKFALIVLTNSSEAVTSNIFNAALEYYFDDFIPLPKPIKTPKAELREYTGVYENIEEIYKVTLEWEGLVLRITPKGGFPTPDAPPLPAPPPMRFAFYEKDKYIILNTALKGRLGEFLRDERGRIKYMRLSRIHTKKK